MSDRTVAIIQARVGSTRFPRKMLAPLGGFPVLAWVLSRVVRARTLDQVVLALPDTKADDMLVDLGLLYGATIFRGSETDVLSRFIGAAELARATVVVRVCADNPLIAPEEIDRLVTWFANEHCEYGYNHIPTDDYPGPDGLGAEIVRAQTLEVAAREATDPSDREHVTRYIVQRPDRFICRAAPCTDAMRSIHRMPLDVDTPEDLELLKQMVDTLTPDVPLDALVDHLARFELSHA